MKPPSLVVCVALVVALVVFVGGCCTRHPSAQGVFLQAHQSEGQYILHPTSVFELERFAKSSLDGAVAVCRWIKERHADDPELVEEMNRTIQNYDQVTKMDLYGVAEIEKQMSSGDRLFWFELDTEAETQFGLLILSPEGSVVHRTVEATLNK